MNASDFPKDEASPVDAGAQAQAHNEKLQVFGSTLAATRDKWIRSRASGGWDKRAQRDIDQYHGLDYAARMASNMMESVEQGYPVTTHHALAHRSTVFVGITRQKTNAGEARLSDIVLPTDDRNWGIQPTPDPELVRALKDDGQLLDPATGQPVRGPDGQPLVKKDVAKATQEYAKKAAEAMQQEIEDQLTECDYNSEVRKVLHDAAMLGTGVLKGPMVVSRTRRAWREVKDGSGASVQVLEIVKELRPASMRVDPRQVWEDPACGDNVHNGRGIFEVENLTSKQVRDLAKQPGYILDQLRAVLTEGPQRSAALQEARAQYEDPNTLTNETFQHWIYWGELDKDDIRLAGVDVKDDDELDSVSGCVEMINNTVVRAYLNPLEDGCIPYDFMPWEKVSGSVRGFGIPHLMHAEQSVTNSAWRQMLDNAGVTSGPQIILNRQGITPADGQWTITPRKIWYAEGNVIDVTKAFTAVNFDSHQTELANIIEMAGNLGDQETAVPAMALGERGSAPDTVGGMQLLMNSANVVLRRLVKQFDDYVTKPHIRRYYDYNMAYSDDDAIKGDFSIDARGSSALIVRDIQNQAYTNLLAAASNPAFAPMIDHRKLFEKALQAQHIDPADIVKPQEQVDQEAKANPPQEDPRVQTAKIKADADAKVAQAIAQGRAAEVESRTEQEMEDRKLRMQELELQYRIAVLNASVKQNISIDQVKASLAQAAINDRTKKELAASEMAFKETSSPDHKGI
jgi:hypothetical protein